MSVRVVIVDDHRVLRDALRALLKSEPDFEVVAEAADAAGALAVVAEHAPDVLIIDVRLPDRPGIEVVREVCSARRRRTRVIALSAHADQSLVHEIIDAGAADFVLKDQASEELPKAIRRATAGEMAPRVESKPDRAGGLAR